MPVTHLISRSVSQDLSETLSIEGVLDPSSPRYGIWAGPTLTPVAGDDLVATPSNNGIFTVEVTVNASGSAAVTVSGSGSRSSSSGPPAAYRSAPTPSTSCLANVEGPGIGPVRLPPSGGTSRSMPPPLLKSARSRPPSRRQPQPWPRWKRYRTMPSPFPSSRTPSHQAPGHQAPGHQAPGHQAPGHQ